METEQRFSAWTYSIHVLLAWVRANLAFPGGSAIKKNLSAKQETQVQSLGQADPLEEEVATHSSILA